MTQTKQSPAKNEVQSNERHAAAATLFNTAREAGLMPKRARRLLAVALAFRDAAEQIDAEHADRVGRDLALAAPLDSFSSDEQCIIASALVFQRAKLRREREPSFIRLTPRDQTTALQLAALLYLADGLHENATMPMRVQVADQHTLLLIGSSAAKRLATLEDYAKQWRKAIGTFEVQPASARALAASEATDVINGNGFDSFDDIDLSGRQVGALRGDESLSEGMRRMLRRQFEKMLARAEAVQHGEDVEDIHQMRVATRRLRASLQIVETAFEPKMIKRFRKELRRIAQALGTVRDQDVLLEHVRDYQAGLPEEEQLTMLPLLDAISERRAKARARLLEELEAKRYTKFICAFAVFVTTPNADTAPPQVAGLPPRVRDGAGSLIWRRYEELRAFDAVLPDAPDEMIHNARIAGKRLRYTLELFAEAFGSQADALIEPFVGLQDTLGALQDDVVAQDLVGALDLSEDAGAEAYLAARRDAHTDRRAELPDVWNKMVGAAYRRRLAEQIVKL